jgi:hypothetical protein
MEVRSVGAVVAEDAGELEAPCAQAVSSLSSSPRKNPD